MSIGNITKKSWFIPALLGGMVTLLVLSTRRSAAAAPSGSAKAPPGTDTKTPTGDTSQPGTTTPPPADAKEPDSKAPPVDPTEVILESGHAPVLALYRSLMSAMQADIHSVDPNLLRETSRKLRALGHQTEAVHMWRRAKCADEVYNSTDLDFFPLSCAAPEHVVFDSQTKNPLVSVQALSALLVRYADAMSKSLYANIIPADKQSSSINVAVLDAIVSELLAASLTKEAENLRARRDQLYQLKFDKAIKHLATNVEIQDAYRILKELNEAGYPALVNILRPAIETRQRVLSRSHVCKYGTCYVFEKPDRGSPNVATQAPVTVLGSVREWSHVLYDKGEGWIHTSLLAPIEKVSTERTTR